MQALVLAGGEGTRLRPLTLTVPKPVLPLCGQPFLTFMLAWLRRHGVDDVILSCGFMSDAVERVLGERWQGVRLRYVREEQPLGTGGPLRLAYDAGLLDERLFMLNGDVLTDIDLSAQREQHERTGAVATLALVAVEDTASYGVVPTATDGRVEAFLEKVAGPAPTNRINAGAYLIERSVAERIAPGRPVSMERDVFPLLVGEGLYGHAAGGYWVDIGTPERYMEATRDLLAGRVESELPPRDESGSLVLEDAGAGAAEVGPETVVGRGCTIGAGSRVSRSVLFDDVEIGEDCVVEDAILGARVLVEDGGRVEAGAVLGEHATIADGATVPAGARVAPGEWVAPE